MGRSLHMGMSIRGVLRNGTWRRNHPETLVGTCLEIGTGRPLTEDEIFKELCDELAKGHELIPLCSPKDCPEFDPKSGCPGHEMSHEDWLNRR